MSEAKEMNYTSEMVERMLEVYDPEAPEEDRSAQVEALAQELGKSAASVRAKLVREKVYVPKSQPEAGKRGVSKAVIVSAIAKKLNVDEDVAGSLEKANKKILAHVLKALSSQ